MRARLRVELRTMEGELIAARQASNSVLRSGADLIARLFSGQGSGITHMAVGTSDVPETEVFSTTALAEDWLRRRDVTVTGVPELPRHLRTMLLGTGLLLLGDVPDTVWGLASLLVAFYGLAVAIVGWLVRPLRSWERLAFAALGLMSIVPYLASTGAAALGIAAAWLWLRRTGKSARVPAGSDGLSHRRP